MKTLARTIPWIFGVLAFSSAPASIISGIDFPQGTASFADAAVLNVGSPSPDAAFIDPNNALGVPDVNTTNGQACFFNPTTANCLFTSLGTLGSLTLRFTNNVLTGSSVATGTPGTGDAFNDLYIFEVGVAEASTIDISKDGTTWFNVGSIGGTGSSVAVFSYGFDIDKLGFGYTDSFTYVRIIDSLSDGETSPSGADIDAVGAIQTVVPIPATVWLLGTGLAGLVGRRWRRSAA